MIDLEQLLLRQHGVVTRAQLTAAGLRTKDLARLLRHGDLVPALPGVYVDATGRPTWLQRAQAAVLWAGPGAALCHGSAVRAAEGPGRRCDLAPIEVAVPPHRSLDPLDGIVVHRSPALLSLVEWHRSPPRVRYDDALLDVTADASSDVAAVEYLVDRCAGRRTTATRLLEALCRRETLPRRALLLRALEGIVDGTCSTLRARDEPA